MTHLEIPLARRDSIAERLKNGKSVMAAALALEFDVSEDAIRRDLRALAAEGVCRRVYGGALPLPDDTPMVKRVTENLDRKAKLAKAGAETIQPRELVFLDSGSTNLAMVEFLPEDYDITVVTNSVVIAAALLTRTDLRLIVVGGNLTHQMGGCVDGSALLQISRMNIDRVFIGACAVSTGTGICGFDHADVTFKRTLINASRHSIVLATNEKFSVCAPHRIAEIQEIQQLVVEHDLPRSELEILELFGAPIICADP